MYQIDNSTAVVSQPAATGAGTAGFFTDGNPATSTPATILPAEWLNAVMMELSNVVTGAGLTLSKPTYTQVRDAIKRLVQNQVVLTDTGAANAYAAANSPALVAGTWTNGVTQQVKITNANTGASTYAPDGLTAIPIYGLGLQPLQSGELIAGGTAILMKQTIAGVNSGNPVCVLLECSGGAQQVAPATQSNHAMQLGQATGRLLNIRVITASGTYTPTAGTNSVVVEVQGGGGGGGGSSATGAGQLAAGSGGNSGSYGKSRLTSGFSGVTVTVGAAGSAGAVGGAGGTGGTSSFGALISAPGGTGGAASGAITPPSLQSTGSNSAAATSGNLFNASTGEGQPALMLSTGAALSGAGANTLFGNGPSGTNLAGVGGTATNYGCGGAGALTGPSASGFAGGAGAQGVVVVWEYA